MSNNNYYTLPHSKQKDKHPASLNHWQSSQRILNLRQQVLLPKCIKDITPTKTFSGYLDFLNNITREKNPDLVVSDVHWKWFIAQSRFAFYVRKKEINNSQGNIMYLFLHLTYLWVSMCKRGIQYRYNMRKRKNAWKTYKTKKKSE